MICSGHWRPACLRACSAAQRLTKRAESSQNGPPAAHLPGWPLRCQVQHCWLAGAYGCPAAVRPLAQTAGWGRAGPLTALPSCCLGWVPSCWLGSVGQSSLQGNAEQPQYSLYIKAVHVDAAGEHGSPSTHAPQFHAKRAACLVASSRISVTAASSAAYGCSVLLSASMQTPGGQAHGT